MISISPVLYVDPNFDVSPEQVRDEIQSGDFRHFMYFCVFTENCPKAEILPAFLLKQSYYQRQKVSVFGVAESKENAEGIMAQAFFDAYTETGECALYAYVFGEEEK